jgi:hypothetical protein
MVPEVGGKGGGVLHSIELCIDLRGFRGRRCCSSQGHDLALGSKRTGYAVAPGNEATLYHHIHILIRITGKLFKNKSLSFYYE